MRRTVGFVVAIALLTECESPSTPTERIATIRPRENAALQKSTAAVQKDLATLRRVTAPFHKLETARDAGWSEQITVCMSDPVAGGMGFHYGKPALIDGTVRVEEPELLLYEPEKNGRLRLVAVEYIVPYTAHSRASAPPVLFGQEFQQNDVFQLWGLHAWVWKENPSGMFAPWNPKVGCQNATTVSTMSHG